MKRLLALAVLAMVSIPALADSAMVVVKDGQPAIFFKHEPDGSTSFICVPSELHPAQDVCYLGISGNREAKVPDQEPWYYARKVIHGNDKN